MSHHTGSTSQPASGLITVALDRRRGHLTCEVTGTSAYIDALSHLHAAIERAEGREVEPLDDGLTWAMYRLTPATGHAAAAWLRWWSLGPAHVVAEAVATCDGVEVVRYAAGKPTYTRRRPAAEVVA